MPTPPTTEGTTSAPGTSTQQPQQPAAAAPTEGKTFTQAEVDALVAKRVSKAEKAVEKRLTQAAPIAQPNTPNTPPVNPPATPPASAGADNSMAAQLAQLSARLDQSEADRAFAETIASVKGGDVEKMRTIRPMFDPSKPEAFIDVARSLGFAPASADDDDDDGTPKDAPGPGLFRGPGAPSGPPSGVIENDPTKWSKDYIQRLRSEGTFLQELDKWAEGLPGGSNGVFKKRIPKG